MKRLFPILILLIVVSCGKEPIMDANIHFEGFWKYQRDADSWMTISINEKSKGEIFYVGDGWPGTFATITKTWYLKKESVLLFGKNASDDESFVVDTPPTVATNEIYTEFDTIIIGQLYMYLDGNLFIDQP